MPFNSDSGACVCCAILVLLLIWIPDWFLGVQHGTSDIIHMNSGKDPLLLIVRPGKLPACQSILQIAGDTV